MRTAFASWLARLLESRQRLVGAPGGERDVAAVQQLERLVPVLALQLVEVCQRRIDLALAELGPGGEQRAGQVGEHARVLFVEGLRRLGILFVRISSIAVKSRAG